MVVVLSIQDRACVRIRLREMMDRHALLTGEKLTYAQLSEMVGLAPSTIESMASRRAYNPTLRTLARLCVALGCAPGELLALEIEPDADNSEIKIKND